MLSTTCRLIVSAVCCLSMVGCGEGPVEETTMPYWVYFGTSAQGAGISRGGFDPADGTLTLKGSAAQVGFPGFVEIHPDGELLYSLAREDDWHGLAAYRIDPRSGELTELNRVLSGGRGPAHVTVDHAGRTVAVANYGSGGVSTMRINADGSLSEAVSAIQHEGSSVDPERQQGPHAHSVNFSPDDRFLLVADLGLDQVVIYKHDPETSRIEPHGIGATPPGGGPRHFSFHPNGRFGYVNNEMGDSVTAFDWSAEAGTLESIQTISTLPEGVDDTDGTNSTAEILVDPAGKFLYCSNRGHNSIAVFSIDSETGALAFVEAVADQVATPRNFRIGPEGRYLLAGGQVDDSVSVFRIDPVSGGLTPTGGKLDLPAPICIRFLKAS